MAGASGRGKSNYTLPVRGELGRGFQKKTSPQAGFPWEWKRGQIRAKALPRNADPAPIMLRI
jgi:hypothetical protein